MNGPLDFAAVNGRLLSALPSLVAQWLPGGRLHGREWLACNPRRADRRPGSFKVNVATGKWADFATGESGGDPVSLYAYLFTAGRQGEAARELAGEGAFKNRVSTCPPAKAANPAKVLSHEAARVETARAIYAAAKPLPGTPAEAYLSLRGLRPGAGWAPLRAALLPYRGDGWHPTLVAPVRALSGQLTGIQRTYLTRTGRKIGEDNPKLSLGIVRGGAIRLGEPAGELMLCEGLEDGLSLAQELAGAAIWVAAGAGMMAAVCVPDDVSSIVIAADNDEAGEAAAQRAAEAFARPGRRVSIMRPDPAFKDWNDQLRGKRP